MFAHATGFSWDEALLVLAPLAVIAALLVLANNRAKKLESADRAANPVTSPSAPDREEPRARD